MKRSYLRGFSGFTLMELMAVVAIISILAAVGYPSYADYVRRSRMAEATAALSDVRIRMEQFFQDHRTYASAGTTCGAAMPADNSFHYTCDAATADTFVVTATGLAASGMNGFTFDVDQNNQRRTTAFPGVSGTQNCWMTKGGDSC